VSGMCGLWGCDSVYNNKCS